MAFLAKYLSFFFLFTLLLKIHARDSQFFNKIPTNHHIGHEKETTKVVGVIPKQEQEPKFMPESDNGYGVYGHESGQLPPSTNFEQPYKTSTTSTPTNNLIPNSNYLPKNYDPVAYVTVPEPDETNFKNTDSNPTINNDEYYNSDNNRGDSTFDNNNNKNQYYNDDNTYESNNNQYYRSSSSNYNNQYYHYANGGSTSYNNNNYPGRNGGNVHNNNQEQNYPNNYGHYNNGGNGHMRVQQQQQGMSDTRLSENGKYFYDVNTDKYVIRDPYENSREFANSYANNELRNYNNNNFVNYENEEEFHIEEEETP